MWGDQAEIYCNKHAIEGAFIAVLIGFQRWKQEYQSNQLKKSDFCKLLRLPIFPILKTQLFPLSMLIFIQKSF